MRYSYRYCLSSDLPLHQRTIYAEQFSPYWIPTNRPTNDDKSCCSLFVRCLEWLRLIAAATRPCMSAKNIVYLDLHPAMLKHPFYIPWSLPFAFQPTSDEAANSLRAANLAPWFTYPLCGGEAQHNCSYPLINLLSESP